MASEKDSWDKLKIIINGLAVVAIPVVLFLGGQAVETTLKEKDVRLKTVEMAVGILQQDPKENPESEALREWAIKVVDEYSGVPLSPSAADELKNHPLPFILSRKERDEALQRLSEAIWEEIRKRDLEWKRILPEETPEGSPNPP